MQKNQLTLSTLLTISRIALTPFIITAMIAHQWGLAVILFAVASVTDMLDGHIARIRNEHTELGAILDPIADKILLLSCFTTLAVIKGSLYIPAWFAALVIIKEAIILIGSTLLFCINTRFQARPTLLGKSSTVLQTFFLVWLFLCHYYNWLPYKTYSFSLIVVAAIICLSCIQYITIGLRQALPHTGK
ncbi:phosphatidylglycerophosphate synthase [Candidatus Dependentiae bacterium Noda2021]|nr:phosphatidylglycerophosphate synthase [Candidatus Dependentiae bacterium Noda2021]